VPVREDGTLERAGHHARPCATSMKDSVKGRRVHVVVRCCPSQKSRALLRTLPRAKKLIEYPP
jgi:hypothetical protein